MTKNRFFAEEMIHAFKNLVAPCDVLIVAMAKPAQPEPLPQIGDLASQQFEYTENYGVSHA